MVRVKITPRKRKKRVRFLDEVQADASRPGASYTPPPTSDADILNFIHKKAAEQRQAQPTLAVVGKVGQPHQAAMGVRQCLPSSRRVCQETGCPAFPTQESGQTTPTRRSSSTHAQEETPQTKDLHDPDGTGPGLSQHCPASVFSSQTIDLQFVGGTRPSQ